MKDLSIEEVLHKKFGYSTLKLGQKAIIESIVAGKHTFGILPTGGGKSLCYQLPTYLLNVQTVIVTPLLSLMEDQVHQLQRLGEKRAIALSSLLDFKTKEHLLKNLAQFQFIFLSPEMLLQPTVLKRLASLNIGLFVIDEAHCVSQWGLDFRPEYSQLLTVRKELHYPLTLALTATATPNIQADIIRQLFTPEENVTFHHTKMDRENIFYQVEKVKNKLDYVKQFISTYKGAGLIYFSSKKEAENVAKKLSEQTHLRIAFYHGSLEGQERMRIQQQFLNDQLDVLCATSAFGMGINKPNIRYVIHYHLSASLEAYIQETGRAGRDGKQSQAILLYQNGDEEIHHYLQAEGQRLRQEFSLLKKYPPEQWPKLANKLQEIQQKWLTFVLDGQWTLEELERKLIQKEQQKAIGMEWMLRYIHTEKCRRTFLLNYFEEEPVNINPNICCDNCTSDNIDLLEKRSSDDDQELENSSDWQNILKNLFF